MKDKRIKQFIAFLDTLPDIDEYRYKEDGKYLITNEWLCGTFAGRGFVGDTPKDAAMQLMDYFDEHLNHKSWVGGGVTESGWPDLDKVKSYIDTFDRYNK